MPFKFSVTDNSTLYFYKQHFLLKFGNENAEILILQPVMGHLLRSGWQCEIHLYATDEYIAFSFSLGA